MIKIGTRYTYTNTGIFLMILMCGIPYVLMAATDNFTIQMQIAGNDTQAPTIPGNVVATPVATTQINLSWDASTDDSVLSGYHIWRDGVQIATTSLTSYVDGSLTSLTTYAYIITAYDAYMNESASSTEVSTTTLQESEGSSSVSGTRIVPFSEMLISIVILPEKNSVRIIYDTQSYIKGVVKIGKTTSYEIASFAENTYAKHHEIKITDLDANSLYYVTIEGDTRGQRYGSIFTSSFKTVASDDVLPPSNIHDFSAIHDGDDIVLSWNNPSDTDFEKIRIIRNDTFFPIDSADGYVIYDGTDTRVRDTEIKDSDGVVYYTAFTYDALGNISGGAVLRAVLPGYFGTTTNTTFDTFIDIDPEKNDIQLTFTDVHFLQNGAILPQKESTVFIDGSQYVYISIPYNVFPEHLKTILVTVKEYDAIDAPSFSFLLRANKEKTVYEGTVAPFGIQGYFPIYVSVFDYKTQQIGHTQGFLQSEITEYPALYMNMMHKNIDLKKILALIFIGALLCGLFLVWRKK